MSEGREVWVKIRASKAERAEWHAKARSVGLSLSDLVRRSVGRVRTWTVAHAELERERTRGLARIGSNLNQIARWANIHKEERRGGGGGRASGRHRAGARHLGSARGERAMMIKFLARGTGSAAAAADYLTREPLPAHEQDQDQEREQEKNPDEVKVLRGNPHQVAEVADALQFEHKYTSGVIAWAPEDKPSDAQIGRVVDEFEKTAWARDWNRTATPGQRSSTAKRARVCTCISWRRGCDLETGKSLNIAAPGWQKMFDALRDWQNHENGWSRPDDSERARDVQPGHRAYIEAAQLRSGLEAEKDPRRLITDYLSQGIETGAVSDRATMVSALQRAGLEVVRQGEHYLTASDPESGGKWRLKGAIYERDFQRERLTSAAPEEGRAGPGTNRSTDSERAEEARKKT